MKKAIERSFCTLFCFVMLFSAALPVTANALEAGTDVIATVEDYKIYCTEDFVLAVNGSQELTATSSYDVVSYKWELSTDGGTNWTNLADTATYTISNAQLNVPANVPYQYRVTLTSPLGLTATKIIRVLVSNDYSYKAISLRNGDTTVSAYIHKDTRLVITPLADNTDAAAVLAEKLEENCLPLMLYDVSLVNQDDEVVPYFGRLTVSFHVGSEYDTETLKVFHLHGNPAAVTEYSSTVSGGELTIVVDGLSPFMVEVPSANTRTVTASAGAGGAISPSGTINMADGSDKTFTLLPNAGYELDTLKVNGVDVTVTGNSHTLENITENTTIAATFRQVTPSEVMHTVTVNAPAHGSVYPSGGIEVRHGSAQTIYFHPAPGYELDTVKVDGVLVNVVGNSLTLSAVTADTTVIVAFKAGTSQPPNVFKEIAASAGAHGVISPSGSVMVEYGGDMYYYFIPDTDYQVDTVKINGVETVVSGNSYHFVNVIDDNTINVTFKVREYTVTASAGAHGSISPSGSVQVTKGTSKTFTFTPDKDYEIDAVKVDGTTTKVTNNTYTFSDVNANHTIAVTFKAKPTVTPSPTPTATPTTYYTLTASAEAHGKITPSGSVSVAKGYSKTFYLDPDDGYELDTLKIDGKVVNSTAAYYTFSNVKANHAIVATFKETVKPTEPIEFNTVTVMSGENGDVSPSGVLQVTNGGAQTFYFIPNEGYEVGSVTVNGEEQALVGNRITVENISEDTEISVTFTPLSAAPVDYHCFLCSRFGKNIAPWCIILMLTTLLAVGGGVFWLIYKKRKK